MDSDDSDAIQREMQKFIPDNLARPFYSKWSRPSRMMSRFYNFWKVPRSKRVRTETQKRWQRHFTA